MQRRSRKQSRLGLASVSVAVVTCGYLAISHGLWLLALLMNHPQRVIHLIDDISTVDWFLPIIGLASIGFSLGLAGVIRPRRHRFLPSAGMLLNLAVICDVAYQWSAL